MKAILVTSVAALIIGAASAQAQDATQASQVVVHYEDLNVSNPAGAKILMSRIEVASAEACGNEAFARDLRAREDFKSCSDAAQSRAIAALPFNIAAHIEGKPETVASR